MANLLSKTWLNLTGGATIHKHSGAGTNDDPAIPHVITEGAIASLASRTARTVSTTSTELAPNDETRAYLSLTNCAAGLVYVSPEATPSAGHFTYQLNTGDTLEVPAFLAALQWNGVRASGSGSVSILEGVV